MCAVLTLTGFVITVATVICLIITNTNVNLHDMVRPLSGSESTKEKNGSEVLFTLFTRHHSSVKLEVSSMEGFTTSGYNITNPTKIIIHGFQSSIQDDVFMLNKNAYLQVGDMNIIGLDWSLLCQRDYISAINGVHEAGNKLLDFLIWLSANGVNLDDVHLIGHSLGAHVAGIGANGLQRMKVARITGLDPAGPGFANRQSHLKLDPTDAKVVEVVHTNVNVLSPAMPLGYIDFYPNGGRRQPGCPDIYNLLKVKESLLCNHARAYQIFAESIVNKHAFQSKRCGSVDDALYNRCYEDTDVYMGQIETYKKPGLFYFRTRDKKPFSLDNN